MTPISTIRNLGPATEAALIRAGVGSAEELREMGADAAYLRLMAAGERPHFIGYYVLHMALQGRPWNDCKGPEKEVLRAAFDRLVAESQAEGQGTIEAFMREIGLYDPAQPVGKRTPGPARRKGTG